MTFKQRRLLTYIAGYVRNHSGVSPTYDEIQKHLGLKTKSRITAMIVDLESQGLVRRVPTKARSIYPTQAGLALLRGDVTTAAAEMEARNG